MRKRHVLAAVASGSGAALALLGFLLALRIGTGYASPAKAPADVPDLIIDVRAGDGTVLASEVISYVLVYTNTLDDPLSDVVISSTLSPQQYFTPPVYLSDPIIPTTSFTYTGTFLNGHALEWQLETLAAGADGWIVVTTTVPPEAEPPWNANNRWPLLGMSAVITTSTPGVSTGNLQGEEGDSASVMVVGPVLRLTKTDDPDPVHPGWLLTYTLTLENADREDAITAHGIVITDAVPENTAFHSASAPGVYSPTSSTGLVIWQPSDPLEPGETMEVTFTVRLTETACELNYIWNRQEDYLVNTAETIQAVMGSSNQSTRIADILEKVIETPAVPSGDYQVFPGGIVTYTISVYNPLHEQPISGMRLTDTLPGDPNLFTFLDMLTGTEPVTTYPEVVWEGLSVDAGGVTDLSFRAQVPEHIHINANQRHQVYYNDLSAFVSGLDICDMKYRDPSRADVYCQVCLSKDVEPKLVLPGEMVTYTLTLENVGETMVGDIRLTDTLPSGIDGGFVVDFYYVDMVDGPEPAAVYTNAVVWDGLSVDSYDETELSFRAVAIGRPLKEYGNNLSASAPDTTIPDITNRARVKIDTPLTMDKTVDPTETFVEQSVDYTIVVCNVATGTYTIDMIADDLPDGFYAFGVNHFVNAVDPPADIAPGECWEYPFTADVTIDVGCVSLPYTYRNLKGNVGVHLAGDPPDSWWLNAVDLAPLLVKPHVAIDKEADHTYVMPGEMLVYTVTLTNESLVPVNNVTIVDTLPGSDPYFEFVEMISGPSPSGTTPPTLEWTGQTVPAQGQLVLVFRVHVPDDMPLSTGAQYRNDVQASTPDWVCIEDIDPTPQVRVIEEIVEFEKVVSPADVSPLGVVEYDIRLKTLDSVAVTGVTVTETLPSQLGQKFEFVGMRPGDPEPDEVSGRQVIWRDLTVPPYPGILRLRFDARAPILFGVYYNEPTAWCPRSEMIEPESPSDVAAPVTVLPGVVLYKTVFPTQTLSGRTILYTITLYNQTTDDLADVIITDTLPTGFSYGRMATGYPSPDQVFPEVVWSLGQVNKQTSEELVFYVQVGIGVISGTYTNKVVGHSPSAQIPGAEKEAPVQVEAADVSAFYLPLVLRSYVP